MPTPTLAESVKGVAAVALRVKAERDEAVALLRELATRKLPETSNLVVLQERARAFLKEVDQ